MALTDQPYLPLYVDDWMNNNKLKLCGLASHGLMVTIMCLMHKEQVYGKILLKQKFKQTDNQISNFALQVAKQSAFDSLEVLPALEELVGEEVLVIEDDFLVCKRMVKDHETSVNRAISGQKGGLKTQSKTLQFALAKREANSVNGIGIVNGISIGQKGEKFSEDGSAVIFSDGSEQKLTNDQLARLKEGALKPHYVKKELV